MSRKVSWAPCDLPHDHSWDSRLRRSTTGACSRWVSHGMDFRRLRRPRVKDVLPECGSCRDGTPAVRVREWPQDRGWNLRPRPCISHECAACAREWDGMVRKLAAGGWTGVWRAFH